MIIVFFKVSILFIMQNLLKLCVIGLKSGFHFEADYICFPISKLARAD